MCLSGGEVLHDQVEEVPRAWRRCVEGVRCDVGCRVLQRKVRPSWDSDLLPRSGRGESAHSQGTFHPW